MTLFPAVSLTTRFSSTSFFKPPVAQAAAFESSCPASRPIFLGLIPSEFTATISNTCCCFGVSFTSFEASTAASTAAVATFSTLAATVFVFVTTFSALGLTVFYCFFSGCFSRFYCFFKFKLYVALMSKSHRSSPQITIFSVVKKC